jgi:transcriptional regulator with XRE-family HTH domain
MRRPTPTARRWQLGQELRALREAVGVTPAAAAKEIQASTSTLSRIESGKQGIRPAYVTVLSHRYKVDDSTRERLVTLAEEAGQPEWHTSLSRGMPDWFRLFLGYEGAATSLATYCAELVPGLLQTEDYIRAIFSVGGASPNDDDLGPAIKLRRGRQELVLGDDPTPLHVVLNEAVLRRAIGGPDVMRGQLRHLAEMSSEPTITVQVLPFAAGAHPAMDGSFTVLGFADEWAAMSRVYLENGRGADLLDSTADLDRYRWIFAEVARLAHSPEKSRDLLVNVADDL